MMTKKDIRLVQDFIQVAFEKGQGDFQTAIVSAVEQQVKTTVNGKIESLRTDFANYRADDEKWKREVQPSIDNMRTFALSGRLIVFFIVAIGGLAAFLANIGNIVHSIIH